MCHSRPFTVPGAGRELPPKDFDVRFWDGSTWHAAGSVPARFTLILNHPEALQNMFSPPLDVALGESYAYGDYDIEGDFESAFRLADYLIEHDGSSQTG